MVEWMKAAFLTTEREDAWAEEADECAPQEKSDQSNVQGARFLNGPSPRKFATT
jgi:hypothetical protein